MLRRAGASGVRRCIPSGGLGAAARVVLPDGDLQVRLDRGHSYRDGVDGGTDVRAEGDAVLASHRAREDATASV